MRAGSPVLLEADHGGGGSKTPEEKMGDVIGDLSLAARP